MSDFGGRGGNRQICSDDRPLGVAVPTASVVVARRDAAGQGQSAFVTSPPRIRTVSSTGPEGRR